jgi:hypothetical protein
MILPDVFIDRASPAAMYAEANADAKGIVAKVLEVLGKDMRNLGLMPGTSIRVGNVFAASRPAANLCPCDRSIILRFIGNITPNCAGFERRLGADGKIFEAQARLTVQLRFRVDGSKRSGWTSIMTVQCRLGHGPCQSAVRERLGLCKRNEDR